MPRKSHRARRAIALRREGKSAREAAAILGCSIRTVWRDTAGIDLSEPSPSDRLAGAQEPRQPRSRRDGRFIPADRGQVGRITRIGWGDSLDQVGLEREQAALGRVPVSNPLRPRR